MDNFKTLVDKKLREQDAISTAVYAHPTLQDDTLDQFVEMAAESSEIPNYRDAEATEEVIHLWEEFEQACADFISKWVTENGRLIEPGVTAQELYDTDGPYLMYMTLVGHGVGTWDGSWDTLFVDSKAIDKFNRDMENDPIVSSYANEGGAGKLDDAFLNAAYETTGYEEDEDTE